MKLIRHFGMVMVFLLVICSFAFATGVNVYFNSGQTVKNHTNSTSLPITSLVQWVSGSSTPPHPDKNGFINSGSMFDSFKVGDGMDGLLGTFARNDTTQTGATYLRIWEASSPAKDGYYCNVSAIATGLTNPLPGETPLNNIYCNYKAAQPLKPTSVAKDFSLAYNSVNKVYLPSFTISLIDTPDPDGKTLYEVVGRNMRIKKHADTSWKATYNAASQQITETNPDSQYYIADGVTEYEIQSQSWNYFGGNSASDWGPTYTFTIPSSGGVAGPGGPSIVTFDLPLYAPMSDKLVVNLIASPIQMTASSLEAKINSFAGAGKSVVVAISKSLPGSGSYAVYIPGDTATPNFTIKAGEGVQVYLTEAVPGFKLDNQLTNQ